MRKQGRTRTEYKAVPPLFLPHTIPLLTTNYSSVSLLTRLLLLLPLTLILSISPTTKIANTAIMSDQTNQQQTPSTLQSYVNSASGAVQSAIGNLTGNTGDQAQGQVTQDQAKAEHEQSKAGVKAAGVSVTSDGGVAKDSADRTDGSWNQTIGSAKEAVGGLLGHEVRFPSEVAVMPKLRY